MWRAIAIAIAALMALAACDNPPCASPEAAERAAEAYRHCISMNQQGAGGYACGGRAYETHCKAREASGG